MERDDKKLLTPTLSGAYELPRPTAATRLSLRVVHPASIHFALQLGLGDTELGRDRIDHSTVSRRHFAVRFDESLTRYRVRDLGSRNGTRLNGRPLGEEEVPLEVGSVVRIGDVLIVVESVPVATGERQVSQEAIPGDAASTQALRSSILRCARDTAPVLLVGETGTGKEKIAGEIHRLSGRTRFVGVNCAGLNAQLVESQLFGHVRGAFTGADAAQQGLFRSADGGTLLLDEIGDLPLELQPKLLRAIEESEVLPVGSTTPVRVDVRIVAATHRDLARAAEADEFRRDLYARLSLWEIRVPPLRERRADIFGWIDRFSARRHGGARAPIELGPHAAELLLLSAWPSNLRGVDRLVHELEVVEGEPVSRGQLPGWLTAAEPPAPVAPRSPAPARAAPAKAAAIPTREEFVEVFNRLDRNVRATAKHFRRDRRQIYRWMSAYGLKGSGEEP